MSISWRGFWPPCHSSPYPVKEVTLALVNTSHLVLIVYCNNTCYCVIVFKCHKRDVSGVQWMEPGSHGHLGRTAAPRAGAERGNACGCASIFPASPREIRVLATWSRMTRAARTHVQVWQPNTVVLQTLFQMITKVHVHTNTEHIICKSFFEWVSL